MRPDTFLRVVAATVTLACLPGPAETGRTAEPQADGFRQRRVEMVAAQIEARGIRDPRVLAAMARVERHRFVPPRYRRRAYGDHPLPIGFDQTISQPYIVALMSAVLDLRPDDRVLEVGTGSGYQAAVLGELCRHVYSIEIVGELGTAAARLLDDLGYENVTVRIGDGYRGWPGKAPFDAIIVTCAPTHVPDPLKEQLAEGGRMVIPVGERGAQELVVLRKEAGRIRRQAVIPVRFVPMVGPDGKTY